MKGAFCHHSQKLRGLASMFDIAGPLIRDSVHMLLFAFDGKSQIQVSAFAEDLYEIIFPGTPLSVGTCACFFFLFVSNFDHIGFLQTASYDNLLLLCLTGDNSQHCGNVSFFEIIVEEKHMSPDCYIVVSKL